MFNAGGCLAVDRDGFSQMVTEKVANHPMIEVVRDEITELQTDVITVIATGPLTSDALAEKIHTLNDGDGFYFYDAAAPIIDVNTIDMSKVYLKSRYDKGEAAYLNAPMISKKLWISMKLWSMQKKHRLILLKKKSTLKDVCLSKSWPNVALKPCFMVL